ncbi:MAG: amidase family protein, partial [Eubacterium sp.]
MELTHLTIHETKDAIAKGDTTAFEVTKAYAERINSVEKKVDAFLQINTEAALEQAKAMDSTAGPLAGIPYALKDNLCTRGIRTTCASKILDNFV